MSDVVKLILTAIVCGAISVASTSGLLALDKIAKPYFVKVPKSLLVIFAPVLAFIGVAAFALAAILFPAGLKRIIFSSIPILLPLSFEYFRRRHLPLTGAV